MVQTHPDLQVYDRHCHIFSKDYIGSLYYQRIKDTPPDCRMIVNGEITISLRKYSARFPEKRLVERSDRGEVIYVQEYVQLFLVLIVHIMRQKLCAT